MTQMTPHVQGDRIDQELAFLQEKVPDITTRFRWVREAIRRGEIDGLSYASCFYGCLVPPGTRVTIEGQEMCANDLANYVSMHFPDAPGFTPIEYLLYNCRNRGFGQTHETNEDLKLLYERLDPYCPEDEGEEGEDEEEERES